eukprot:Gb_13652 [translate_table: standard]
MAEEMLVKWIIRAFLTLCWLWKIKIHPKEDVGDEIRDMVEWRDHLKITRADFVVCKQGWTELCVSWMSTGRRYSAVNSIKNILIQTITQPATVVFLLSNDANAIGKGNRSLHPWMKVYMFFPTNGISSSSYYVPPSYPNMVYNAQHVLTVLPIHKQINCDVDDEIQEINQELKDTVVEISTDGNDTKIAEAKNGSVVKLSSNAIESSSVIFLEENAFSLLTAGVVAVEDEAGLYSV